MRIEKAKEMVAKLGDLASLSEIIDIKISIGTASSLMCLIKDLHNEVGHLRNVLGRPATGQLVEDHLLIYGNAYIYDGLLLDPTKMVIRRVARPGKPCAEEIEADYRSLRGELATIFGTVKPHHGMSWNACMLARIGEVLAETEESRKNGVSHDYYRKTRGPTREAMEGVD